MESQFSPYDAVAALAWQVDLGADEAILDAPVDRYGLDKTAPKPAKATPPPVVAEPTDPAVLARQAAADASDLPGLHAAMAAFSGTDLREAARNCVFADGLPTARVMIIGEAPGRDEDREGRPFVGRAGQLLDRMFAAIGLSRTDPAPESAVYISNVLPWRPPQNRAPTPQEIAMFLPFLQRHIALADPDFLVLMGNTPCQALLGRTGITRMRGQWVEAADRPCLPMFHPAYLLRNPIAKREAWADLLALQSRLTALS